MRSCKCINQTSPASKRRAWQLTALACGFKCTSRTPLCSIQRVYPVSHLPPHSRPTPQLNTQPLRMHVSHHRHNNLCALHRTSTARDSVVVVRSADRALWCANRDYRTATTKATRARARSEKHILHTRTYNHTVRASHTGGRHTTSATERLSNRLALGSARLACMTGSVLPVLISKLY